MNIKLALVFSVISFMLNEQNCFAQISNTMKIDTIVCRKTITNEIAGSSYRKRAIGYFVVIGGDTSDYTCIFMEFKDGGKVGIDLNIPYGKVAMTYRQRIAEIRVILREAAKDFDLATLTSITLGRLILTGDLAIDITKQYRQKFGVENKLADYAIIREFLVQSKLGTDLNSLLRPYSMSVRNISLEHLFFTTREDLYWASKIETEKDNVPDKILDCLIWITLSKT